MASIKLKHSGGNGTIIAAPTSNPASDKTLTLPSDVDGTIVSKDSSNSLQNITGVNGGQLGNRRLTINGDMRIAQRGASSTTSGYSTVDRFKTVHSGTDEAPTYAQVDVAAGTTPYTLGFRKALKITNGNQTSGAGTADFISYAYRIEAQDIANSGWNYTSTSSYITLSFWIKSSVAQDFKGYIRSHDGTSQAYAFATGSLSADTWTKITKTISGNSNLTFDNNNDVGFEIVLGGFWGTDYTNNSVTEDAWAAYASGTRMKDNTSTWYTTNDSTIELTGLQLEAGSNSTSYEFKSYAQELALCQRYYFKFCEGNNKEINVAWYFTNTHISFFVRYPTTMRAAPTLTVASGSNYYILYRNGSNDQLDDFASENISTEQMSCYNNSDMSGTAGQAGILRTYNASAKVEVSAEL